MDIGVLMNIPDKKGCVALHYLAMYGKLSYVKELLVDKADVKLTDNEGWTPLHYSVANGHISCVREILANGADVDALDCYGYTPLQLATLNGHADCMQELLLNGADPNIADNLGWTSLHNAAFQGHIDSVKVLFATRCKAKEKQIKTAVQEATGLSEYPCTEIADMARPYPDIFARSCSGCRPIDSAKKKEKNEIIITFLRKQEIFFR